MTAGEWRNAQISSAWIGTEDHGILTAYIIVEGDGWGCGLGGYNCRGAALAAFVEGVLDKLGVRRWEELVGMYVQVRQSGGGIDAIRPIMASSDRDAFVPAEVMAQLREGGAS